MSKLSSIAYSLFLLSLTVAFSATSADAQRFGPWSVPVNAGAIVNSKCNDQHPALSEDGLTLVFASNRAANATDPCVTTVHLWVSQRDSLYSPWNPPQAMSMLNSPLESKYEDMAASFANGGHWIFFHSQRPSECVPAGGVRQLWAAYRRNNHDPAGWEAPINLGCGLNGQTDDAGPTFFEDRETGRLYLYFTRDLTSPTLDPAGNGFDIYVSTCFADLDRCNRQQLWTPGTYVPELSSPLRDTRTAISHRDGLEMIMSSTRTGTLGGLDLWRSTRKSVQDDWSIPINLNDDIAEKGGVAVVNTAANEGAPALSWEGQALFFYSNGPGGFGGNDLYISTRQALPSDHHRRFFGEDQHRDRGEQHEEQR